MKTCKSCKHWTKKDDETRDSYIPFSLLSPIDPDTFEPMKMPFEVRKCSNPKLHFCERTTEKDGFCIADALNYAAVLATAEDFGCVKHEDI